jgi:hypothetical protein
MEKSNNSNKTSIWQSFKKHFRSQTPIKIFPWLQSGFILLGFSLGVLATSAVDLVSLIDKKDNQTTINTEEDDKCIQEGGRYDYASKSCILNTSDRGGGCMDSSECEGWCLVDEKQELGSNVKNGYCSEEYRPEDCFKFADQGKVNSICLE